jgi:hypothetical protein
LILKNLSKKRFILDSTLDNKLSREESMSFEESS